MKSPSDKPALIGALQAIGAQVTATFLAFSSVALVTRPSAEAWSAAENLDHVIRAVQPVTLALRLRFGTAESQAPRSYEQIRDQYVAVLAGGATASGRYVPAQYIAAYCRRCIRHARGPITALGARESRSRGGTR